MTQEVAFELRDQIQMQRQWETMTREQKQQQLLLRQKELLDKFLERRAISQEQYDKSLGVLRSKNVNRDHQ